VYVTTLFNNKIIERVINRELVFTKIIKYVLKLIPIGKLIYKDT